MLDSLSKNTLEQIFAADIESRQRVMLIIAGKNIADIAIIPTIPTLVLIRSGREEQAMLTTLAGVIVVLMMIIPQISNLFSAVKSLFDL